MVTGLLPNLFDQLGSHLEVSFRDLEHAVIVLACGNQVGQMATGCILWVNGDFIISPYKIQVTLMAVRVHLDFE